MAPDVLARASALVSTIESDDLAVNALAEQVGVAGQRRHALEVRVAATEQAVGSGHASLGAARSHLRRDAVSAYLAGGSRAPLLDVVAPPTSQASTRQVYLHAVTAEGASALATERRDSRSLSHQTALLRSERQGLAGADATIEGLDAELARRSGAAAQAAASAKGPLAAVVSALMGQSAAATESAGYASLFDLAAQPDVVVAPPSPAAATAVTAALAQVGKPYEWGGAGPAAFDCSGLVLYAWAAGVSLPHASSIQYQVTERLSLAQLAPGDLVFYDEPGDSYVPGHVTLYVGAGMVVAADHTGTDIRVEPLSAPGIPMGFGRVI